MQRSGFTKAAAVTQHDTTPVAPGFTVKAVYCGGAAAANLKVTLAGGGGTVVFTNVQPGTVLPIAPRIIFDASTTFADADLLLLGD